MPRPIETSPLLSRQVKPTWRIWESTSPGHRFYLLLFICLVPFGGHFVKNEMSALEQLLLDDPVVPVSNTMYGALNSAVSIPNMIVPFFGGHVLDSKGHDSILIFLVVMCIGQAIFTYAMDAHIFWLALVGRTIFGLGEGSVVAGARAIMSFWFDRSELTCAMGVMIATTNMSKMLAKATVAPLSLYFGGYIYGFVYGLVTCIVSLVFGIVVVKATARLNQLKQIVHAQQQQGKPLEMDSKLGWLANYLNQNSTDLEAQQDVREHGMLRSFGEFSLVFWLVVALHVVFINAFHLFQNISSSYLYQVHSYSIVDAGVISSLSSAFVIIAPFVGLLIDYVGGRMVVIVGSCFLGVVAYILLVFTSAPPLVAMLLFSICLAATPTILMASIPLSIPSHRFGLAFGLVEVIDAVGGFVGNLGIGYLRDVTGSYDAVMFVLLGLTCLALVLSLVLAYVNRHTGGNLSSATVRIPLNNRGEFAS
ncbi:unnamed protein product [Aphanomyces euteiches]|uniref:Lysosomal dipeptide transporter MFSD1 n=1 Tax=Aphanomyces euteiches TaxID=100861 RepID=A0A6G0WCA3_9STRA|nr:hypothetical protein Ae201684_016463 [Aphanomyces euteiches]KAH9082655.1 hypothetical protein Ae201684P_009978 [Aphanomyces euteiches]KAH9138841.1 hypothetical protein AeRB84_016874 [Aphanomyces euteiches]